MKRRLLNLLTAVAVLALSIPSISVSAAKSVTITLRAGNVGTFNTENVEAMVNEANTASNVEYTENYIKITGSSDLTFEQLVSSNLGVAYGSVSDINYALSQIVDVEEGYMLLSEDEWGPAKEDTFKRNDEFVLDYGVLVNPVKYTVNFYDFESYDSETDTYDSVAAPIIAYGSDGDEITVEPILVNHYSTNNEAVTLTLSESNPENNVVSFFYVPTDFEYIPGETTYETQIEYITETQIVTLPAAVIGEGGVPLQGGDDAQADDQGANIEDNRTPLEALSDNIKDIIDSDTPLAAFQKHPVLMTVIVALGIGVVILLVVGVVALIKKAKKKKGTDVEDKDIEKEEK